MGLADVLHSGLVLCTTGAYALPLFEAIQRRSTFYTLLFTVILTLSFALHCEESGLCAPYEPAFHDRLAVISQGMSYYLFGIMTLVALEIRSDLVARAVVAIVAIAFTVRDVYDTAFNVGGMLAVGVLLLVVDSALFSRSFSAAYWRRLAVIAGMAGVGALIFRAVHSFWWHGVWHIWLAGCIHLLLLAQRTKRLLARGAAGAHGGRGGKSAAAGFSSNVADSGLTTPLKRKGGGGAGLGVSAGNLLLGGGGGGASAPLEGGAGLGGGSEDDNGHGDHHHGGGGSEGGHGHSHSSRPIMVV